MIPVERIFTMPGGLLARTNGLTLPEKGGLIIGENGIQGWDSAPPMRRKTTDRPNSPGAFRVPGNLTARTVALSGTAHAETPRMLWHLRRRLSGVLAGGGDGVLSESGTFGEWSAGVARAEDEIEWDWVGLARCDADWQIQFLCADPRKYGEERTYVADEPVWHDGNFTATGIYTVAGNLPDGYTLAVPAIGLELDVLEPLTTGHPHMIDMADGSLVVDGEQVAGGLSSPTSWGIPEGAQVVHTITPGAALTTRVRDTDV